MSVTSLGETLEQARNHIYENIDRLILKESAIEKI